MVDLERIEWSVDEDAYEEAFVPVGRYIAHVRYDPLTGYGDWWIVEAETKRVVDRVEWLYYGSREELVAQALDIAEQWEAGTAEP